MPETEPAPADDLPLGFTDRGHGPTVLLLHGIGSARDAFDRQLPALEGEFRCIAWDAPGYGGSADPDGPPDTDGYADAAAALLDRLGAGAAHVVGVSWGGVLAVRLALRHPETVRSLVLAGSTRGSGGDRSRAAAMRLRGRELDRLGPSSFAALRAPNLLSPTAPAELVRGVAGSMARAIRNPGYGWAAESMAQTDHLPRLAGIRVPVLVVVGEHDTVTTVDASRELAAAIPTARLEVIPDAGHLVNQEQAPAFNRTVGDFLRQVERHASPTPSHQGAPYR